MKYSFNYMKYKNRLYNKYAYKLIGVMDEWNILKSDEVYVRLTLNEDELNKFESNQRYLSNKHKINDMNRT